MWTAQLHRPTRDLDLLRVGDPEPSAVAEVFAEVCETEVVEFPTLLDLPTVTICAYQFETAIAEKIEAMVELGMSNSRMKDFYDVYVLAHGFEFDGKILQTVIRRTLENHNTSTLLQNCRAPMIDEDIHDDAGARRMLDILTATEADAELRGEAAIKLGPGLQLCDERMSWDDPDLYFGKATFEKIDQSFRRLYHDASTPRLVRRRILEAAVRAPMDWHEGAVRAAWETEDDEWRQTAVLGMGNIPGFEDQLLDILQHDDLTEGVLRETVRAAGNRGLDRAEPIVRRVALKESQESYTRQLAIEALIWCGNDRSERALEKLIRHSDSDIADTAEWALGELRMFSQLPDDPAGFDDDLF